MAPWQTRDTCFSKDKSSYKTNLGFRFWLSPEVRRAKRVGLYVQLDLSGVGVYGGAHRLAAFCEQITVERYAASLRRILADLKSHGYALIARGIARTPGMVGACVARAEALKPLNDWFSEALLSAPASRRASRHLP